MYCIYLNRLNEMDFFIPDDILTSFDIEEVNQNNKIGMLDTSIDLIIILYSCSS